MADRPLIVGLGGTTQAESSTECALRIAIEAAGACGARTLLFDGPTLSRLPHYGPGRGNSEPALEVIQALRDADGVILASPGYHGSVSGLVKNAIDYFEETARDARAYLDGLPVGLIATAYGWQATGSTLAALRSIVHALRGWPTPFGAGINVANRPFSAGACNDPGIQDQLETVGKQVFAFASMRHHGTHISTQIKAA